MSIARPRPSQLLAEVMDALGPDHPTTRRLMDALAEREQRTGVEPRATTPVYGWHVPVLADAANVPYDMTELATDIETTMRRGASGITVTGAYGAAPPNSASYVEIPLTSVYEGWGDYTAVGALGGGRFILGLLGAYRLAVSAGFSQGSWVYQGCAAVKYCAAGAAVHVMAYVYKDATLVTNRAQIRVDGVGVATSDVAQPPAYAVAADVNAILTVEYLGA